MTNEQVTNNAAKTSFSFGAWMGGDAAKDEEEWREKFRLFSEAGILNFYVRADKEKLEETWVKWEAWKV